MICLTLDNTDNFSSHYEPTFCGLDVSEKFRTSNPDDTTCEACLNKAEAIYPESNRFWDERK